MGKWGRRNTPMIPNGSLVCTTCGKDMSRLEPGERTLGIYGKPGVVVVHCDGRSANFGARMWDEPHHNVRLHPPCWHCGHSLGCRTCSGIEAELLCMNGAGRLPDGRMFGHGGLGPVVQRKAFIESGPLLEQKESDYPIEWQEERQRFVGQRGPWPRPKNPILVPIMEKWEAKVRLTEADFAKLLEQIAK